MTTDLVTRERETYEQAWAFKPYAEYSPGVKYLPLFLDMTRTTMRTTVLDAGCGSGKGALALKDAGFDVTCCDLTPAGLVPEAADVPFVQTALWADLKRQVGFRDWVYCTDVLEHIPPTFTMLVVSRLLEVSRRGVFLSIALMPDEFGKMIGKPLHQSLQNFAQWREQLDTVGHVIEARDLLHTGVYLVHPR
jgi:SAM-dependent methyltransferase